MPLKLEVYEKAKGLNAGGKTTIDAGGSFKIHLKGEFIDITYDSRDINFIAIFDESNGE